MNIMLENSLGLGMLDPFSPRPIWPQARKTAEQQEHMSNVFRVKKMQRLATCSSCNLRPKNACSRKSIKQPEEAPRRGRFRSALQWYLRAAVRPQLAEQVRPLALPQPDPSVQQTSPILLRIVQMLASPNGLLPGPHLPSTQWSALCF